MLKGKIFARLIYKNNYLGIDTGYASLEDVPAEYRAVTAAAWESLFGGIPMVPAEEVAA